MLPSAGAKICRSAGSSARLISVDGDDASLKMPSGEIRIVKSDCRATIGSVEMETIRSNHWKGWQESLERASPVFVVLQ